MWQSSEGIFLNQGKYAVEILSRFAVLDCKFMATSMDKNINFLSRESSDLVDMNQYRHIIESLMYLMNTRPYICFVVNTLSQYLVKPIWFHLIVAKHVMRYLKGMIEFGLYYDRDHGYRLYGYTDSNWPGSAADRKRTSCECYCLGST